MSNLTATEEVLLAATSLVKKTKKNEFTEWDLTVNTWKINKNRWGLRGYEIEFPDHKRVMNEIMAKGTQKVLGKGWLKRIRPNYYNVTSSGFAKAESLSGTEINTNAKTLHEYNAIEPYVNHDVFVKYCKDPSEPKTWLGAAAFLKLTKYDSNTLKKSLLLIKNAIESSLAWLDKNQTDILRRDDTARTISRQQILKLKEFVAVLQEKFEKQFEAIIGKK